MIHEIGHALATTWYELDQKINVEFTDNFSNRSQEGRVNGFGTFLFFIYPGAYVDIQPPEGLPAFGQLKIYCAGAWHNLVIALLCFGLLFFLPFLLTPFYSTGGGAVIAQIAEVPFSRSLSLNPHPKPHTHTHTHTYTHTRMLTLTHRGL